MALPTPDAGTRPALDRGSFIASLAELRDAYEQASPWPHLVLDGFLTPAVVAAAEEEEAVRSERLRAHRSHREVKAESSAAPGPAAASILAELESAEVVAALGQLTGIGDLHPDAGHFWAGLHVTPPGGFQALHRDFARHPESGLHHRVNVLVYLNRDWRPEYRGALELWPAHGDNGMRTIEPVAGRIVVFATDSATLHAVDGPLACPPGRVRLSLASYLYSTEAAARPARRGLLRPRRPGDPWTTSLPGISDMGAEARRLIGRAVGVARHRGR